MTFKSGFVAILGRPNVGKSTFLNHVMGQKIAIMSDKAQTTRNKIMGIYTTDKEQIVFIDTPGIHKPKTALGDFMVESAYSTLREVDTVLFMVLSFCFFLYVFRKIRGFVAEGFVPGKFRHTGWNQVVLLFYIMDIVHCVAATFGKKRADDLTVNSCAPCRNSIVCCRFLWSGCIPVSQAVFPTDNDLLKWNLHGK